MNAESAYLFRHALLRDAAYQLQLPGDRARLHALALELIESAFGGRPAWESNPLKQGRKPRAVDPMADELAAHARAAMEGSPSAAQAADLLESEALYLWRAAIHHRTSYRLERALRLYLATSAHSAAPQQIRMAAMTRAGITCMTCGRAAESTKYFREALNMAREANAATAECVISTNFAEALCEMGQLDESERLLRRALELARRISDTTEEAPILMSLAIVARRRGQAVMAVELLNQTLNLARETEDEQLEGQALHNLGNVLADAGRFAEAESALNRALAMDQMREVSRNTVSASLAELYFRTSRPKLAEPLILGAIAFARRTGMRRVLAIRLITLAAGISAQGRRDEALRLQREAAALAIELEDERLRALCASLLQDLGAKS